MKIKKGDKVKIILGKDRGREGIVEKAYKKSRRVLVKGINTYKKHIKKSENSPKGGIMELNRPLLISKVILICPNCKEITRVGYLYSAKGQKQRICRKCKKIIK